MVKDWAGSAREVYSRTQTARTEGFVTFVGILIEPSKRIYRILAAYGDRRIDEASQSYTCRNAEGQSVRMASTTAKGPWKKESLSAGFTNTA